MIYICLELWKPCQSFAKTFAPACRRQPAGWPMPCLKRQGVLSRRVGADSPGAWLQADTKWGPQTLTPGGWGGSQREIYCSVKVLIFFAGDSLLSWIYVAWWLTKWKNNQVLYCFILGFDTLSHDRKKNCSRLQGISYFTSMTIFLAVTRLSQKRWNKNSLVFNGELWFLNLKNVMLHFISELNSFVYLFDLWWKAYCIHGLPL